MHPIATRIATALAAGILATATAPAHLAAQQAPPVGAEIRVHPNGSGSPLIGEVVAVDQGRIFFRVPGTPEDRIADPALDSIEVGHSGTHWDRGMMIGLGVGILGGFGLNWVAGELSEGTTPHSSTAAFAIPIVVGGALGAGVGALFEKRSWQPLVGPVQGGAGAYGSAGDVPALALGVRISF